MITTLKLTPIYILPPSANCFQFFMWCLHRNVPSVVVEILLVAFAWSRRTRRHRAAVFVALLRAPTLCTQQYRSCFPCATSFCVSRLHVVFFPVHLTTRRSPPPDDRCFFRIFGITQICKKKISRFLFVFNEL